MATAVGETGQAVDRNGHGLVEERALPPIAELARPMHRLAGYRINPRNSAPWRSSDITAIRLRRIDDETEHLVLAPRGTTLGWVDFAPDGSHLSYMVIRDTGVELWVVNVITGTPRPLTDASLNATWGNPCEWLSDSSGVLCRFRMSARGARIFRSGTQAAWKSCTKTWPRCPCIPGWTSRLRR